MAVNRLLYLQHPLILNLTHYCTPDAALISAQTCDSDVSGALTLAAFYSRYIPSTRLKVCPEIVLKWRIFSNVGSPPADVSADASQLPQRLFGFAGLIPDGFESRVIRLSPKGQRACQVSPHISVVLLTP